MNPTAPSTRSIGQLYGDSRSGNCYKVAWIMRLTGQPFEWLETDVVAAQTRTPEFLALNPNGRVPLLQFSDGRCLAESNAMLLHLAEGSDFLPSDPWLRALTYQWLFFEQYSHEPYIAVARFILQFSGRAEQEAGRLRLLQERGHQALAVMQQHLLDKRYFLGDAFSVADIALYAYTHVAADGGFDLRAYDAIRAWLQRIEARADYLSMAEACR